MKLWLFFSKVKEVHCKKKLSQLSDFCFLTYPNSTQQLRDRLLFWNVNSIDEKDKEQVNYDPKSKPWYQKAQVTYCNYFLSLVTPLRIRDPITSGILNTKWQSAPNSLTQDFSTLSMGWLKWQMEGGEEDLNENYSIVCNSSITEAGIFKAVCDIWRPLLRTEVPPSHGFSELCYNVFPALPPHMSEAAELRSAEQLSQGGKCIAPAQWEGWCSKGPAERDSPSCRADLSPSLHPAQGAILPWGWTQHTPASAHGKLRCLHWQKAWGAAVTASKIWGLVWTAGKSPLFLSVQTRHHQTEAHPSVCTCDNLGRGCTMWEMDL